MLFRSPHYYQYPTPKEDAKNKVKVHAYEHQSFYNLSLNNKSNRLRAIGNTATKDVVKFSSQRIGCQATFYFNNTTFANVLSEIKIYVCI